MAVDTKTIEENLANWKKSLFVSIPVAGLLSRNPVAYKWKAPFRTWMIREATLWRLYDLMTQSLQLHQQGHGLGTRILLRSGVETLAILIHLNQLMQQVLDGSLDFHRFDDSTARLLIGSQRDTEGPRPFRIGRVLEKTDKQYPGMKALYGDLSESAHPNFEGLCLGYSKVNHDEFETSFSNRWMELYGDENLDGMILCIETFHHEYDVVWVGLIEKLEAWIVANDSQLEATKNQQMPTT